MVNIFLKEKIHIVELDNEFFKDNNTLVKFKTEAKKKQV